MARPRSRLFNRKKGRGSYIALLDMQTELRGTVPKIAFSYTKTLINRAWEDLRRQSLWSFQLFEGQWIAPPQVASTGTATTTQGSTLVNLDATATAAVNALAVSQPYSLITQRQFRISSGGIYNIWGYNPTGNSGNGQLILDRWYGEPSLTNSQFSIFQCYYVPTVANSPITDFRAWISVRDMQNFTDLFTERYTMRQIDAMDPQRTWYGIPSDVVPYQDDQNPSSPTYGSLMFFLWGLPTFNINYQLYGVRGGMPLSNPADTLPYAVGQDVVMAKAKYYAYEWAEANKDSTPRNSGPDFKFLMGAANKEYDILFRKYRQLDRDRVDNWFAVRDRSLWAKYYAFFNSQGGVASPGFSGGQW
jgi:hypothetical protein